MNHQIEILDDMDLDLVNGGLSLSFSLSDGFSFESGILNVSFSPVNIATDIFSGLGQLTSNLSDYLTGVGTSLLNVGGLFSFS